MHVGRLFEPVTIVDRARVPKLQQQSKAHLGGYHNRFGILGAIVSRGRCVSILVDSCYCPDGHIRNHRVYRRNGNDVILHSGAGNAKQL